MTKRRDLDQLVSELARSHHQALERNAQEIEASKRRFLDALEGEARSPNAQGRRRSWRIADRRLTFAVGVAALVAAIAVGVAVRVVPIGPPRAQPSVNLDILPEPAVAEPSARGMTSTAPLKSDPCARAIRGSGTDPLIDDFEDGDSLISPREGRGGAWMLFRDSDPAGGLPLLAPVRRSPVTARNHRALHVVVGELRDWGASIQVDFQPSCYDASAYQGMAFSAKGPGRIYLTVREMRVVPEKWGGTCSERCYNVHQKKIDLAATWHSYLVPWSELRQRGYHTSALDPTRVHDVAFLVRSADTPFDLWIDDVSFVVQHAPSPNPRAGRMTP
jgi:hypothetical protein